MAVVCNVKPVMGELEFKVEKRPKPLIYVKIHIDQEQRQIRTMSDIKVKLEHTQIIQHIAGLGPAFEIPIGGEAIDLDAIVATLLENDMNGPMSAGNQVEDGGGFMMMMM